MALLTLMVPLLYFFLPNCRWCFDQLFMARYSLTSGISDLPNTPKLIIMTITDSGKDIALTGKSGTIYYGRIYEEKNSSSTIDTQAIVCLSNSHFANGEWQHTIMDIYDTANVEQTLDHFRERADISHLILVPRTIYNPMNRDFIDDLRQKYIHA